MKLKYLFIVPVLFISGNVFSQWLNFDDETDTRMVISNIADNESAANVDDMEKDFGVADFDNDSYMDLVVVRKVPLSSPGGKTDLLFMNRNGVLVDETDIHIPEFLSDSTDARDAICVDVDMDGWVDIFVVTTFSDQPKLFMNRGEDKDGNWLGFADETSTRLPFLTLDIIQFCAAWSGDVTGNEAPDIYMVNYDSSGLALDVLYINDGNGNFTDESDARLGDLRNSSFGTGVELHDVDNDNDIDVIKNLGLNDIEPFGTKGTIVLFNEGDGTFENFYKLPGEATYMFTAGYMDDDDLLDIYEVDDFQDYMNNITGFTQDESLVVDQVFNTTPRTQDWGGNVKMADLDADGDLDVALSSVDTDAPPCFTNENRRFMLFRNEGDASGEITHPYGATMSPWNVSTYDHDFIDLDNDGNLDLILGLCEEYKIFINDAPPILGTNDIELVNAITVSPNPNDGIMDITFSNLNSEKIAIKVMDINGRQLATLDYDTGISSKLQLDLNSKFNVGAGIYFLKFTASGQSVTRKIVIK